MQTHACQRNSSLMDTCLVVLTSQYIIIDLKVLYLKIKFGPWNSRVKLDRAGIWCVSALKAFQFYTVFTLC